MIGLGNYHDLRATTAPRYNGLARLTAAQGQITMRVKTTAFFLVLGLSVALFVALRKDNRADAAAGDCYAAAQGPSTPTICQ
jgi:hypothetical protein